MDKHTADKLIVKTRDDYNLIADQFASTRKFNWGDFAKVMERVVVPDGAKVADLGCGSGRAYELVKRSDIEYFGLDISKDLIEHAKRIVPAGHFTVGDMTNTQYHNDQFDLVISVAAIHHIPSKKLRGMALREMHRIVKPGGSVVVTAWYFWDKPKYLKLILRSALDKLLGRSALDFGDFNMEWKIGSGEIKTSRYFHAWRKREIIFALKRAGFTSVRLTDYIKHDPKSGRNLILICTK
jgi:ubiquinone/menaquinone biosynthesis C-methylase UbiE